MVVFFASMPRMKYLVAMFVLIIASISFLQPVCSIEDQICPCDVDAGGNCIPCDEPRDNGVKQVPDGQGDTPDISCPCAVDAGGNCLPCKEEDAYKNNTN